MGIHCGKHVEPGGRYARFLDFLRQRGSVGATTREISIAIDDYAPGTTASELRHMGYTVECQSERTTIKGRKVFRYWLREAAPIQTDLFERSA